MFIILPVDCNRADTSIVGQFGLANRDPRTSEFRELLTCHPCHIPGPIPTHAHYKYLPVSDAQIEKASLSFGWCAAKDQILLTERELELFHATEQDNEKLFRDGTFPNRINLKRYLPAFVHRCSAERYGRTLHGVRGPNQQAFSNGNTRKKHHQQPRRPPRFE